MRDHSSHIARYLGSGAAAWLGATAALHWLPLPARLDPHPTPQLAALALTNCALFAGLTYLIVRRLPAARRLAACAALVLPGVLGDAFALAFFADFFPLIDAEATGTLAAVLLATYAAMLAAGLVAAVPSERHDTFGAGREDAFAGHRGDGKSAGERTE